MGGNQHHPRIDTLELKLHIERRLGKQKADKYFNLLNKYFSLKLNKSEFDKLCMGLLGRENISLHNMLIRAIISNACVPQPLPLKLGKGSQALSSVKVLNGYQKSSLQSLYRDVFPQSPRKGRTPTLHERKSKDRPSPLGPHGKPSNVACEDSMLKTQQEQSATELLSLGSKPPVEVTSVEDGEEVEQDFGSPGIYSRSPVTAPIGVSVHMKGTKKVLCNGLSPFADVKPCCNNGVLPDMGSLRAWLESKLRAEGLNVSADCANLLNNGLDIFMNRLLKPCLDLAASQRENILRNKVCNNVKPTAREMRSSSFVQNSSRMFSMSMTDFRVAMESNPIVLGENWPVLLEKICSHAPEDYITG